MTDNTDQVAPGHRFCHVAAVHGSSIYIFGRSCHNAVCVCSILIL